MMFFQAEMSNFIGLICGLVMLLTAAKAYVMARDDSTVNWKPAAQSWLLCGIASWTGLFKKLDPSPLNIYLHQAEILLYTIACATIIYFAAQVPVRKHMSCLLRNAITLLIAGGMFYVNSNGGENALCLIAGMTLVPAGIIMLVYYQTIECTGKKCLYLQAGSVMFCGALIAARGTPAAHLPLNAILTGTALAHLTAMIPYHREMEHHLLQNGRRKHSLVKLIVFLSVSILVCGLFLKNEINGVQVDLSDHLRQVSSKISRNDHIRTCLQKAVSGNLYDASRLRRATNLMLNGLNDHWKFFFYVQSNNRKIKRLHLKQSDHPLRQSPLPNCMPSVLSRSHSETQNTFRFYPCIRNCSRMHTASISQIRTYREDGNKYWFVLAVPHKYYQQSLARAETPVLTGTAFFVALTLVFWIVYDKYSILTHQLRGSAARYLGLIEMQNDIIIRFTPDFRLTYVNDVFCRQCGMTRKTLSGMPFEDIYDLVRLEQWIKSSGQPAGIDKLILEHHWGNENICYEWQITPVRDSRNRVMEFQGVGRNISELRTVINAHRESEKKYRRLVDMAREGIVTIDSNAVITFANRKTGEMLGVEPESLKGQSILDYVIDSNQKAAWRKLVNHYEESEECSELVFRRKDGEKVYTNIAVTPLSSGSRESSGVMAVIADMSRFRQLENDLKKVNGKLKNALNLSNMLLNTDPNMIYVRDRDGQIIMYNQAVAKYMGLDYSENRNRDINKLISEYFSDNSFDETDRHVFETMKPYEFDEQVTTTLGVSHWFHTVKTPFSLPDGTIGILGISSDITSRKHVEQKLENSNKLLETKVVRRTNSLNKTVRKLSIEIREKQELQQLLQKESDRIQERLGQDLHDILGQTLTAISIKASILSNMLDTAEQQREAKHVMEYTGKAITQMRNISKTLSYVNVKNTGFEPGMNDFIQFMSNVNQVSIALDIDSNVIARLAEESQNNLFRIAQESIINAVKHGKAANIELTIAEKAANHGTLSVTSDGQGLVQPSDESSKGIGLLIMQTRAAVMGASLKLIKNRNGCLNVFCCFPLSGDISSRRI